MLNDSSFYLFTEFHKSEKETYQLCHYGECNFLSVVIYLPSSFMHLKSLTLKNLRNDAPRWCMHFMDERWAKWDKKTTTTHAPSLWQKKRTISIHTNIVTILKMCFFPPIENKSRQTDDCRNITTKTVVASQEGKVINKKNLKLGSLKIFSTQMKKWRWIETKIQKYHKILMHNMF